MIAVADLALSLNGRPILQQIAFQAQPGEVTVLLGPNGSGKTTLLLCLCAHYRPGQGDIQICGQELTSLSYRRLAQLVAVVPQDHHPVFPYQVREVILLGRISRLGFFSQPTSADDEIVDDILKLLNIQQLADKPYTRISGGERQLVLIGRCLAQEPQVLLLDEPTNHLDFKNQFVILKLIKDLARERQLTVLLTLHDPNMASLFADQVILLAQGRIAAQGPPQEVITAAHMAAIYHLEVEMLRAGTRHLLYPKIG